jgi:hypothetical protein
VHDVSPSNAVRFQLAGLAEQGFSSSKLMVIAANIRPAIRQPGNWSNRLLPNPSFGDDRVAAGRIALCGADGRSLYGLTPDADGHIDPHADAARDLREECPALSGAVHPVMLAASSL